MKLPFFPRLRPVAAVALLAAMSLPGQADNTQYNSGPTCTDGGITATCTGRLTGLGNGDVSIFVSFPDATATTLCHAPGRNGNTAPGQNPAADVVVTGSASYGDPKNGNLRFTVTTVPPAAPTAEEAGCPNLNWRVTIDDVSFGVGTLTVSQGGSVVLTSTVTLP